MHFVRGLLIAALPAAVQAFAAPVQPAALSTASRLFERHPELEYVRQLDNSAGYIKFALPSVGAAAVRHTGREADDDDSVIFELRVLPVAAPCGFTDVELNGNALQRQWDGPNTSGRASLSIDSVRDQHHDTQVISWQASCLHSEPSPLQVLTVTLAPADHVDALGSDTPTGFTITFDHQHPDIVFFSPTPEELVNTIESVDESDLPSSPPLPPLRLPLAILPVGDRTEDVSSLKEEIEKLRLLPTQSAEFSEAIKGQQQIVHDLFKEELRKAKDDIKQCDSLTCMVKTTFQKTKGVLDLARLRYGPKPKASFDNDPDCRLPLLGIHSIVPHGDGQARLAMIQEAPLYCNHHTATEEVDAYDADTTIESIHATQGSSEPNQDGYSDTLSLSDGELFVDDPSFMDIRTTKGRLCLTLGILASSLCLGCLAVAVTRSYLSPRARADRAARREEWRTRRQYRCLARRKAWRDFFARYVWYPKSPPSYPRTGDYDEKRALILTQEAILETAMQREIEALRHPQRLVSRNPAADAEEGRFHPFAAAPRPRTSSPSPSLAFSFSSAEANATIAEAEPLSRSSSLPSYRSRASSGGSGRPPSYKEYDEYAVRPSSRDNDGYLPFGHSVTDFARLGGVDGEGSDISPDSSVIEISPRHSSETLRTEYCAV